jgi:hypothetical protein
MSPTPGSCDMGSGWEKREPIALLNGFVCSCTVVPRAKSSVGGGSESGAEGSRDLPDPTHHFCGVDR